MIQYECFVDETQQGPPADTETDLTARGMALAIWSTVEFGKSLLYHATEKRHSLGLKSFIYLLDYGMKYPSAHRSKRRNNVDVDALVRGWVPIIRGLSTAHDKATYDRCEFEAETLLAPLLTATVSAIREFYSKLCDALRGDPTIPLFVHSLFDAFHERIVKTAPDGAIKELKMDLAAEIAEMVEKDVQPDIKTAIAGALAWRAPEELERVRDSVKRGSKPRLRGRESCLFLVVDEGTAQEATVML